MRRSEAVGAALLLLAALAPLPGASATFVQAGSILGGSTPLSGWTQEGVNSALDSGDAVQPHWSISRFWGALGTASGGTAPSSATNPIEYVYFRLDHFGLEVNPAVNWNMQLNLGSAPTGEVDHLLQMRVTAANAVSIRLQQYALTNDGTYPDVGAFTTGQFSLVFSSLVADGTAYKPGILMRTGLWDAQHYAFELGIPIAWFRDAPLSDLNGDGTGAAYFLGAVFSSGGTFGAVSTVHDPLNHPDGTIYVTSGSTATGDFTFERSDAKQLAFATQPGLTALGQPVPAFTVEVRDAGGVRVPGATFYVTLQLQANPTGAALSGTTTVQAVDGTATFSNVQVSLAGDGYTLQASAGGLASAVSAPFRVVVPSVTVFPDPVTGAGDAQAGSRWGAWAADPGATNVLAENYLKVQNTGPWPQTQVTVDFTNAVFTGVGDASWTFSLDGNLEFACATTLTGEAPQALAYTFAGDLDGAVTCAFGPGSQDGTGFLYVRYRIETVPPVQLAQEYQASFTVSVGA